MEKLSEPATTHTTPEKLRKFDALAALDGTDRSGKMRELMDAYLDSNEHKYNVMKNVFESQGKVG